MNSHSDRLGSVHREAANQWDSYYRSGRHRTEWHLDQPSPELMCLIAASVLTPCRALDLGCGAGTEATYLARLGFSVTALDCSSEALAMTRRAAARAGVSLHTVQAFVPDTGLDDANFDFVNDRSCFHCIEPRTEVLEAYAREVDRLLAPGGMLFIRRFGQAQVDLSAFVRVFSATFDVGPVQEVPFHEPHMPSRIALLRKRVPRGVEP